MAHSTQSHLILYKHSIRLDSGNAAKELPVIQFVLFRTLNIKTD